MATGQHIVLHLLGQMVGPHVGDDIDRPVSLVERFVERLLRGRDGLDIGIEILGHDLLQHLFDRRRSRPVQLTDDHFGLGLGRAGERQDGDRGRGQHCQTS